MAERTGKTAATAIIAQVAAGMGIECSCSRRRRKANSAVPHVHVNKIATRL
jgi:hypothetical protein